MTICCVLSPSFTTAAGLCVCHDWEYPKSLWAQDWIFLVRGPCAKREFVLGGQIVFGATFVEVGNFTEFNYLATDYHECKLSWFHSLHTINLLPFIPTHINTLTHAHPLTTTFPPGHHTCWRWGREFVSMASHSQRCSLICTSGTATTSSTPPRCVLTWV